MLTSGAFAQHIQDLNHPDASRRRRAAEALAAGDERALYPLIKALQDVNSGVQDAAMRALISIGGEVTAYMVLPLLRENAYLRNTAMIILRQIGAPSAPLLRTILRDKDDDIRKFAVDTITDIGACDFPQEIARLLENDPNSNVRAAAAKAIGKLEYREALPLLITALKDEEWVCISALETLALLKEESSIGPVAALLDHPSDAARYAAIEALGGMGLSSASGPLLARLPKATGFEQTAAVKGLVQIGITPSMAEAADVLIALFKTGDWDEKLIALKGLAGLRECRAIPTIIDLAGSLEPSEPENEEWLIRIKEQLIGYGCLEALIAIVSDPAIRYRGKVIAIETLGELQTSDAVPHLIRLMEGNLREVRRASAKALAEMPGEEAKMALRDVIEDRDGHVRKAAVRALGRIGDKASFEPILKHLAVERYRDVLDEGVRALLAIDADALFGRMAELSKAARETMGRSSQDEKVLLALCGDPEHAVRLAGVSGLGAVRSEAAVDRLRSTLTDAHSDIRKCAVMALSRLGRCHDEIRALLRDPDLWVRVAAAAALGDSGNRAMIPALVPLLNDHDPPAVLAAVDAIGKLGGSEAATVLARLKSHAMPDIRERALRALEGVA